MRPLDIKPVAPNVDLNTKTKVETSVNAAAEKTSTASTANATTSIPNTHKSWKEHVETIITQNPEIRKLWTEPEASIFKVRGKTYLKDNVKVTSESALFDLVWFDLFQGKHEDLFHVSQNKKSFVQKAIATFGEETPHIFVLTVIIPGTPDIACVQYFTLKKTPDDNNRSTAEAINLWQRFLKGDDAFRSSRMKLIPGISDGPWVVRKSVGNKPVIIGKILNVSYFQSEHYLEAVIDVASDRVAKHVSSLCRSYSSCIVVDMGFVIESTEEAELPETLLCCVRYNHIEVSLAVPIKDSA